METGHMAAMDFRHQAETESKVMPGANLITGGCLCGKRRYAFKGPPSHVGYCHCSMCRRATGGPFTVLVRTEGSSVHWNTPPALYRSSPIAVRGFCPDCGSPLFLQYDDDPRLRFTAGTLDRPEGLAPTDHYGVESRLPWDDSGPGLPAEETKERF
ncbi:GFA family protein (plasmid) [Sinorhizobium medicae]|uniref:GFA family protein n=2 Tax=Sinorhizobium medicae TaxID=110321 RepID=UPI00299F128C|nr:GFA family protein [Sinorhizobium medicae]WQO63135.1 GFA family protein [Sinorhizobium medicae]WQO89627.1 GFA family protein [Sinorhizobium medicae]